MYKIIIEELVNDEARDLIKKAIGASITSHHIAQEDLMTLQEQERGNHII